MQSLDPLAGYSASVAFKINNAGPVVGISWGHGRDTVRATFWDASGAHDMGALSGFSSSVSFALNDAGRVIGDSYTPGGTAQRGFIR